MDTPTSSFLKLYPGSSKQAYFHPPYGPYQRKGGPSREHCGARVSLMPIVTFGPYHQLADIQAPICPFKRKGGLP